MTDRLDAHVRNGKHAEMLLADPVLTGAFDKLETAATEALLMASSEELLERRADVLAIRRLRQALHAYVDSGAIANRTLELHETN
jgi:hypothetical protein